MPGAEAACAAPPPVTDRAFYHALIAQHLGGRERVLDVGCGRGTVDPFPWDRYPEVVVVGIDPDPSAANNPYLSAFVPLTNGAPWQLEEASFDLVVARYVLEHVRDPHAFFAEVARVLKPGGRCIFLTPNLLNPAVAIALCLPVGLKRRLLRREGVPDDDVFPAFYRANAARRIRRLARTHGLRVEELVVRDFRPCFCWNLIVRGLAERIFEWTRRLRLEPTIGIAMVGVLAKA